MRARAYCVRQKSNMRTSTLSKVRLLTSIMFSIYRRLHWDFFQRPNAHTKSFAMLLHGICAQDSFFEKLFDLILCNTAAAESDAQGVSASEKMQHNISVLRSFGILRWKTDSIISGARKYTVTSHFCNVVYCTLHGAGAHTCVHK